MSQLRFPLREQLRDPVDEAALCRILQGISGRIHEDTGRRRLLPLVLGGVATAAAATAVIAATLRIRHDAGPLTLADGREFVAVEAADSGKEVRLSDGSSMTLSPGAHVEPLESSGTMFSAIVTQGRADFEVRPGGPRHWIVECGLATVEVIGTAFACEREPGRLRVVVQHGVVLVRGERVPHRAQRLAAGQTLDITEETARDIAVASGEVTSPALPRGAGSAGPSLAEAAANGDANREQASARTQAAPAKTWKELARHGHQREAFELLGVEGLRHESEKLGVNDLLALADVARLSGHPAEAVVPLQRILNEFASDPQASLAAFALGRLELDSLGHAQAAVSAFRKALALRIPRGLREDVRARLVEAYAKSGDSAGARRAADAYLEEFPNGRNARAVQGWRNQ